MVDNELRKLKNATNTLRKRLNLYSTVRSKGKDRPYEECLLKSALEAVEYIGNGKWKDTLII